METRRKFVTIASLVLLVLALSLVTVSAQEGVSQEVTAATAAVSFESSFQVLNLSTTDGTAAAIDMYYYNPDGSLATMPTGVSNPVHDSVAYKQSNTYYPVGAASGFNGSVVIQWLLSQTWWPIVGRRASAAMLASMRAQVRFPSRWL
jgi:hypothetical protein